MNKKTLTLHSKFLSYLCSNTAYYTSNVMQLYNIVMLHLTMYKVTCVCYNQSPSCFCRASLLSRASCLLRSMRCCCSSVRESGAGVEWINGSSEKLRSSNGSASSWKRTSASSKHKINKIITFHCMKPHALGEITWC